MFNRLVTSILFVSSFFYVSFLFAETILDSKSSLSGLRPNIVLFLADDQSKLDHSAYGNKDVPTAVTQAFSRDALVFEKAYTGQAICAPSRSILFTGMYPLKNGCYINHTAIRPGLKTLPAYLQELGYDVLLIGKSHIKPMEQFPWKEWMQSIKKEGYPRPAIPIDKVDDYLAKNNKPFCLIFASEYPHGPYFKKTRFDPSSINLYPFQDDNSYNRNRFSRYYASIEEKENEFANVLKLIDKHGLNEKTIVFYADDHGMARGKFTVYDSGLNVAFMVRWPGKIIPQRTNALISFVDFLPSLMDLAGSNSIEDCNFDGKSFLGVLSGDSDSHHKYVFGVAVNQGIQNRHIFPQRSISDGRYRYIYSFNSMDNLRKFKNINEDRLYFLRYGANKRPGVPIEELYDTKSDPYELNNLIGMIGMQGVKNNLKHELFNWMKSQGDYLNLSNSISPIFKVWRHNLDEQAEEFNYTISPKKVGVLKNKRINPHDYGN